ncbi:hypothetical protein [Streptomyces sp. CA-111067]|uniref:hypothetical protein n=1 Tax=Streptomyces sp. CA-111067 TaxID=3240046 RepID=UPI003D980915
MKRTMITAAAALLALAALQGRAAADGTPAAGDPTWAPSGKLLAGAANSADAPGMRPATAYRDTIGPGQTKFYALALDAKSSAYVSAFATPTMGSRVAYNDGLELKLQSADGSDCDSQSVHFGSDQDAHPVGTAVSRVIAPDASSCQEANAYTVRVTRVSDPASDPGIWPLELRFVSEPGLRAGASPRPAPDFGSASPTPLIAGTPQQAHGGPSFETAAAVKTGIWKDRVAPGETRFYKVPVDWGQQATVFSDFSTAPVKDDTQYIGDGVRLGCYSPVRALIDDSSHSYSGSAASLDYQTAPVAYANRTDDSEEVTMTSVAGWYYFAVTVHPDVSKAVSGPVPVTLRIDVKGTAQPAPAYVSDPGAAGIGLDAHDVSSADGGSHTASASGSSSSGTSGLRFVAFAAMGAGVVLLLTLAGWYGTARRRSRRTVDAVPPQGW